MAHARKNPAMNANNAIERTGRELFAATAEFASESQLRSWWCVGSTFVLLGISLTLAGLLTWWPARLAASLLGALLFVRAFILFHDFLHGALLRDSRLARGIFSVYGLIALTPSRYWQRTHNYHHANVGKPIPSTVGEVANFTSDIGSFPLMTTETWSRANFRERLWYRINRHPLTILCAYATVFLYSLTLAPFLKEPRKNFEGLGALLVHMTVIAVLVTLSGVQSALFAFVLPFAIASALGAYLFFAQHNFEGMRIVPLEQWTHFRGALESSSYMKLGPILRWFTGNIGYHHVHHLNALIPFYRLPEAMKAIPELQHPITTSLGPRDVVSSLRLNLWDLTEGRLVHYRDAGRHGRPEHLSRPAMPENRRTRRQREKTGVSQ